MSEKNKKKSKAKSDDLNSQSQDRARRPAVLKKFNVAPRKARLVVNLVRGKKIQDALDTLRFLNKKTAPALTKLINSAVANYTHKRSHYDVDALWIGQAWVDEGQTMKRMLPRAQGRATPIRKRSSHISVLIEENYSKQKGRGK